MSELEILSYRSGRRDIIKMDEREEAGVPTYTEDEIRALTELLRDFGLDLDTFIALGEGNELTDLSPDLDFAYRALLPSLRDTNPTS